MLRDEIIGLADIEPTQAQQTDNPPWLVALPTTSMAQKSLRYRAINPYHYLKLTEILIACVITWYGMPGFVSSLILMRSLSLFVISRSE